jgi:CHAD domain-containing protein
MKPAEKLGSSLDKLWDEFSDAWRKARDEGSTKSIHDLRVRTRRLISTLEISRVLSRRPEIAQLQRQFKKVLKRTGDLRDLQVQLENTSEMRKTELLEDFRRSLKRRESRAIDEIQRDLKRGLKRKLTGGFKDISAGFEQAANRLGDGKLLQGLERLLKSRRDEFLKARHRFDPAKEETLHNMRIALKKLRYTVEAAQPVLGSRAGKRANEMHGFQQLLGNTRDVELLRAKLERWASKRGRKIAMVPMLEQLDETHGQLMNRIFESVTTFEQFFSDENLKPAVEKTQVARVTKGVPQAILRTRARRDSSSSLGGLAVANVVPLDQENHHLGDVGGVVADSLQVSRDKDKS